MDSRGVPACYRGIKMDSNIGIAFENWKEQNKYEYLQLIAAGFSPIEAFEIFESIYLFKE